MALVRTYDMIPEGELKCIWMEAGVVGYKLCDKQLRCEDCPFDAVIRQQLRDEGEQSHTRQSPPVADAAEPRSTTLNDYFEQQLGALLRPLKHPSLPTDRRYSSNHLWFKEDNPDFMTIGFDHVALRLLGPVSGVVFTATPTKAYAHSPCAWIVHRHGTVALKTPIAGTVVQTNAVLNDDPSLLNKKPYDVWLFRFAHDADERLSHTIFPPEKAFVIFHQQADAFSDECRAALQKKYPSVGTTLYDGGRVVESVEDILGSASFFQIVVQKIFIA